MLPCHVCRWIAIKEMVNGQPSPVSSPVVVSFIVRTSLHSQIVLNQERKLTHMSTMPFTHRTVIVNINQQTTHLFEIRKNFRWCNNAGGTDRSSTNGIRELTLSNGVETDEQHTRGVAKTGEIFKIGEETWVPTVPPNWCPHGIDGCDLWRNVAEKALLRMVVLDVRRKGV